MSHKTLYEYNAAKFALLHSDDVAAKVHSMTGLYEGTGGWKKVR